MLVVGGDASKIVHALVHILLRSFIVDVLTVAAVHEDDDGVV